VLSEHGTHASAAVDVLRVAIALAEYGIGREDQSDAA
jgi:hypothetical protein